LQSNKIVIMGSQAQIPPMGGPQQDFGPPAGSAPITAAEIRVLYLLVQIQHGLGRMEEAIGTLKANGQTQDEELRRLDDRTIRIEATLPDLQKTVDRHGMDLNELGKRHTKELNDLGIRLGNDINVLRNKDIGDLKNLAHTAKILGYVALTLAGIIGTAFVTYLFRK
jgi:hypothetical protein